MGEDKHAMGVLVLPEVKKELDRHPMEYFLRTNVGIARSGKRIRKKRPVNRKTAHADKQRHRKIRRVDGHCRFDASCGSKIILG